MHVTFLHQRRITDFVRDERLDMPGHFATVTNMTKIGRTPSNQTTTKIPSSTHSAVRYRTGRLVRVVPWEHGTFLPQEMKRDEREGEDQASGSPDCPLFSILRIFS